MSRNHYRQLRRHKLKQLQHQIGPVENLLFGNQTSAQALRIAQGGAIPATAHITAHAEKLKQFGRLSKAGAIFVGPVLLLMHILIPKKVLQNYFKPPFFRPAEIVFFSGIPFVLMRTVMLMWVLAFPRFGKKRNLTEAYKLAPPWYRIVSAVFGMAMIVSFVGGLTTGIGFYI